MSIINDNINPNWPTIYDLAMQIPEIDVMIGRSRGRPAQEQSKPIAADMSPKAFPLAEGVFEVEPEQLLSLKVPLYDPATGQGFQRDVLRFPQHCRYIARCMLQGAEVPILVASIFPDNQPYVTDGQNRAIAAIITRTRVRVDIQRRTVAEARALFNNQQEAWKLSSDLMIMSGNSPVALYIQEAVSDSNHPWHSYVGPGAARYPGKGHVGGQDRDKLSPTQVSTAVGMFAYNTLNAQTRALGRRNDPIDRMRADQLARLLSVFGTKHTNRNAFRAGSVWAIARAATEIFLRNPNARPGRADERRWMQVMGGFDFGKYPHLISHQDNELVRKLIEHWNKRLHADRRCALI